MLEDAEVKHYSRRGRLSIGQINLILENQ